MTINRNNFEAHLLDYLEGNLDPLLTADLMAFLTDNPEYESYIPEYDARISLNGNHEYNQKVLLKKDFADVPEINAVNFDEFCIALSEGLLGDADRMRLLDFVAAHPEKKKDLELYSKIKLLPDFSVVFDNKTLLKKNLPRAVNPRLLYFAVGIAASLTMLFVLVSKKPAESVYTKAPEKEAFMMPVVPADHTPSTGESATYEKLQASEIAEDQLKVGPVIINQPATQEIEAEEPVLSPLESIGVQEILAESLTREADLSRMAGNANPFATIGESAGIDPLSAEGNQGLLRSLISRVDFWKTAEKAIQGFNYLTEANLDIDKTLDENGKLSAILLNMDSYKISGNKIK